ncbi:hypothetical protein BAE44_0004281 [Dichanthelium oligosanthes]|uniref:Dirigent protein n=1 Tax=Dichanthelium oligosanthes TaxID=888268 RepID=A0A1E5WB98_9POAL|nr:hypothetical protein BAE44_0004281 [Dichanthelium oligosanthes]
MDGDRLVPSHVGVSMSWSCSSIVHSGPASPARAATCRPLVRLFGPWDAMSPWERRALPLPSPVVSCLSFAVRAVDDLLTEGLAADSPPVCRTQGTYMTGSMRRSVFVVSVTLQLTAGLYNRSTLMVAGRDDTSEAVRQLAVVGGMGKLRWAQGRLMWSTAKVESALHVVLKLNMHVSVPVPARTKAGKAEELREHTGKDALELMAPWRSTPRPWCADRCSCIPDLR